ncbi:Pyridoxal 5'-phosphate synthase subunit PdxT [Bienertia sinuspersici]
MVMCEGQKMCIATNLPILFGGDFNEILCMQKKEGGSNVTRREMENLLGMMDECMLRDLGYTGQCYTWKRGLTVEGQVRQRLEMFIRSPKWWKGWRDTNLTIPPISLSCPVALKSRRKKKKGFKFETYWLIDDSCEEVVRDEGIMLIEEEQLRRLKAWIEVW